MNILFIHEIDWIRKPVLDTHLLSESLSLLGHNIYAIDYESMWDKGKSENNINVSRIFDDSTVHLIRPKFIKVPALSRLSAFVSHYIAIREVIKEKRIDAIILYSVPTNGLQAVYLAKKFGIPVIFRSIDILNKLVLYPPLRPITKIMESWVYSRVDMTLTISPELSEYVIRLGANPNKVMYLPIPVDINRFYPFNDTGSIRQQWGLGKDDKIILYMGTLYKFSGLDSFIPKIKYIPDTKLLIVGDGTQRAELESIIKTCDLKDRVIITGFQPYEDMPKYINTASVCINPFLINDITREIFPGKTVQFLACGKPLVATALPGMKAVIPDETQGIVYVNDTVEMVREVIDLLKSDKRKQEIGENGLNYVKSAHSCEVVCNELIKMLELMQK